MYQSLKHREKTELTTIRQVGTAGACDVNKVSVMHLSVTVAVQPPRQVGGSVAYCSYTECRTQYDRPFLR